LFYNSSNNIFSKFVEISFFFGNLNVKFSSWNPRKRIETSIQFMHRTSSAKSNYFSHLDRQIHPLSLLPLPVNRISSPASFPFYKDISSGLLKLFYCIFTCSRGRRGLFHTGEESLSTPLKQFTTAVPLEDSRKIIERINRNRLDYSRICHRIVARGICIKFSKVDIELGYQKS
jgi:hypothetical protein